MLISIYIYIYIYINHVISVRCWFNKLLSNTYSHSNGYTIFRKKFTELRRKHKKSINQALRYYFIFLFQEQIEWAVDGGADYIVAETMTCYPEAKLALDAMLKYGKGKVGYCFINILFGLWQCNDDALSVRAGMLDGRFTVWCRETIDGKIRYAMGVILIRYHPYFETKQYC